MQTKAWDATPPHTHTPTHTHARTHARTHAHIPNTWGIVTKYYYYELAILLASCMYNILLQVSFKIISVSNTAKYVLSISSDKDTGCKV